MKLLSLLPIVAALIVSCKESADMHEIFLENERIFKKIENPIKTNERYSFDRSANAINHSIFDSTYLKDIKQILERTCCNRVYIVDGDVFIGRKKSLSSLCFTSKTPNETIELLNFRGTLNYLLQNGKSRTPPFAIKIAPQWYVVEDINSL